MLEPAVPSHLDTIKPLIRAGAAEGSWDPALATPGPKSDQLFRKLSYALEHGDLPQLDRTGRPITTRIGGWVFLADPDAQPTGFGLFKDFADGGFELWLCAIDPSVRGRGLGRQMLTELLGTPHGLRAQLARCARGTAGGQRCAHILKSLEFETRRTTSREEWLLHRRTPRAVVDLVSTMDLTAFEPGAGRSTSV